MITLLEVEQLAWRCPSRSGSCLVNRLRDSLPPGMDELDDGEGIAEAMRREAEFMADSSMGITLEEMGASVRPRRGS